MTVKVGINGFGRIGRNTFRSLLLRGIKDVEVVAINDLTDSATLAHLFKYDSLYGELNEEVKTQGESLIVGEKEIKVFAEPDPSRIPWQEVGAEVIIEATGRFRTKETAAKHLEGGAKKVIVTTPVNDADIMIVLGINQEQYDPEKHHIISNASCTTNALAPLVKVLDKRFGIKRALMNTTHSYTNDQQLLDLPHPDLRRARAAAVNIIPTSTGAARAIGVVMPHLKGKIDGFAVRVPTPTVSIIDLVAELEMEVDEEVINATFRTAAAKGDLEGILGYSELPKVSMDYRGTNYSSVVDSLLTMVLEKNLIRVISWYDNEWGYSCRVGDLASYISR